MAAVVVGEERLNAELKFVGLRNVGDDSGAFAGFVADAKSLKPSSPKRFAGMDVVVGCATGGDGVFCVKEKFKEFDAADIGACAGFGAAGLLAVPPKKFPPLNGGGEDTCAATGGAFAGTLVGKPKPANADEDDGGGGDVAVGKLNEELEDWTGGGDLVLVAVEKFIPPNASAKPPNASGLGAGGDDIPPKDG